MSDTDFNAALAFAQRELDGNVKRVTMRAALIDIQTAHAEVVAERDSYRDVAHKLARYVLPDSDTLTIRQLVEAADGVCNAADKGDDEEPGKKSDDEICEDYERATGCPAYGDHGPDNAGWQR